MPTDGAPLDILMTQRELMYFGGSELVTVELARELSARGHRIAIYCPRPGRLAQLVKSGAVAVWSSLRDLPWTPDVIHGHQHLPTMAALARFPRTPAIYCWHGFRPWVEQPPVHPGIARYVVMCEWMVPRIQADLRVAAERIAIIPNFVDPVRFSRVRDAARPPRRALLYGHGGFSEEELGRMRRACEAHGLSFEKIGYPYGNADPAPELFLPDYDVVFAIGRCAIEALACGCALIPVVPRLAGRLVTEDTLAPWGHSNFSPVHFTAADVVDDDWLGAQLAAYVPEGQARVTASVRAAYDLQRAADAFEAVYRQAIAAPRPAEDAETAFVPYLNKLALEADDHWIRSEHLAGVEREADTARADLQRLAEAQGQLEGENERLTRALARANWLLRQLVGLANSDLAGANAKRRAKRLDLLARLVRASGLVDADWYAAAHADLRASGSDPAMHFVETGAASPPSELLASLAGREPAARLLSAARIESPARGPRLTALQRLRRRLKGG